MWAVLRHSNLLAVTFFVTGIATGSEYCAERLADLGASTPSIVAYRQSGDSGRPLLVFLHGFQSDSRDFATVEAELSNDHFVLGIDQIGHGGTPAEGFDYSSERLAAHVHDALVRLRLADRPVVLVGHSLGARTATVYAARYPEHVRAMVLEDMDLLPSEAPPMSEDERHRLVAIPRIFASLLDAAVELAPFLGPDAYFWASELGVATDDGQFVLPFSVGAWLLRGHQANREDLGPALATVRAPVVMFQADLDRNARLVEAGVLHARRHLPSVRVVRFAGAGHTIHQTHPDDFVRELRAFVRSTASP